MQVSTYLNFDGGCTEAFQFYEKVLGGKIVMSMTYGETPMADHVSADWRNKIVHVRLVAGDNVLMGCDTPPEYYKKPQGFSVSIVVDTNAEAERIFKDLSENGIVTMAMEETFWASRFGMLTDQFGIAWMVNCEKAM